MYAIYSTIVTSVIIFFGYISEMFTNILELYIKSCVMGGIIGLLLINKYFSHNNLWVFIYNLKINRMLLSSISLVIYVLFAIMVSIIFYKVS